MAGVVILVGSLALTRLRSYSFLEAANSWALEMAIPQKGRYICSTWAEKTLQCLFKNTLSKYKQVWFCYYVHTRRDNTQEHLLSCYCLKTENIFSSYLIDTKQIKNLIFKYLLSR